MDQSDIEDFLIHLEAKFFEADEMLRYRDWFKAFLAYDRCRPL
jgi:hypothetical protein